MGKKLLLHLLAVAAGWGMVAALRPVVVAGLAERQADAESREPGKTPRPRSPADIAAGQKLLQRLIAARPGDPAVSAPYSPYSFAELVVEYRRKAQFDPDAPAPPREDDSRSPEESAAAAEYHELLGNLEVLRRLPEMPPDVRAGAVLEVIATTHRLGQPAPGKEEVVAAVSAFRGTPDEAAVMQGYAGGIASVTETSELSALLLDPPDPAMREIYLMAYAMEIRLGSGASRQVGLGMLPPDLKAEVESRLDSAWSGIDGWFR